MFENLGIVYVAAGVAVFAAAALPRLLSRAPVSVPMVFLGAGMLGFSLLPELPDPDPIAYPDLTMHLTELCVVVSLMGAGLALDRPLGWRRWSTTWRMLAVAMPLGILGLMLLGYWVLGSSVAAALLLASALAPTDPVLASEVQVGEPTNEEEEIDGEDEIRFGLTSEAGLNDGLAFPFVYLAVSLSLLGSAASGWLPQWFAVDVLWRIGIGVLMGWLTGMLLRRVFFSAGVKSMRFADHAEGFVALAATFLAYGTTQMIEGYGFIAVFISAVTIRSAEHTHDYHRVLHGYIEQLERLLTVVVLVLLGGAISRGLLDGIGWPEVLVALVFLLVIRPVVGWLALAGGKTGPQERIAIAFFGIRGIGSLYYLSYALGRTDFGGQGEKLWSIVGLVVAMSVVLHGVLASPVMGKLDGLRRKTALKRFGDEGQAPNTAI